MGMVRALPSGLEWWPVADSRSGNTVAWAYDPRSSNAYVIYAGRGIFTPYAYFGVSRETVDAVRASGYVSRAIAHLIKPHDCEPLAPIATLPF